MFSGIGKFLSSHPDNSAILALWSLVIKVFFLFCIYSVKCNSPWQQGRPTIDACYYVDVLRDITKQVLIIL